MARQLPVGYPVEIFRATEVNPKFQCGLCRLVLRDPQQRYCGHRYCKNCIESNKSVETNDIICQPCIDDGGEPELDDDPTFLKVVSVLL